VLFLREFMIGLRLPPPPMFFFFKAFGDGFFDPLFYFGPLLEEKQVVFGPLGWFSSSCPKT